MARGKRGQAADSKRRGFELRHEIAAGDIGEGAQFGVEPLARGGALRIGAAAVGTGGEFCFVTRRAQDSEERAVRRFAAGTKQNRMHPAGERLVKPGMLTERKGEELEGALVAGIEEDASSARKVGWEVVGALGRGGAADGGLERTTAFDDGAPGLRSGGVGEGGGVPGEEIVDRFCFFPGQDRAVMAAGGTALSQLAGPQGGLEGVVVEHRLAQLAPERFGGRSVSGGHCSHEAG